LASSQVENVLELNTQLKRSWSFCGSLAETFRMASRSASGALSSSSHERYASASARDTELAVRGAISTVTDASNLEQRTLWTVHIRGARFRICYTLLLTQLWTLGFTLSKTL
jgi:hypothetical protein